MSDEIKTTKDLTTVRIALSDQEKQDIQTAWVKLYKMLAQIALQHSMNSCESILFYRTLLGELLMKTIQVMLDFHRMAMENVTEEIKKYAESKDRGEEGC